VYAKVMFANLKRLGVNIEDKTKATGMVLDAIVEDYEKKESGLDVKEFWDFKKANSDMLNWYNSTIRALG